MSTKKNVLVICGSTRKESSNLNLIRAISELAKDNFLLQLYPDLTVIPHFNPDLDLDGAQAPEAVTDFRKQLQTADGILICTPEYAMGVPGTLKNAIDWTVSSCEFSHKPTALITASSVGQKGHQSLLETLKIIESHITDDTQLLIPYIKTKVSKENKITDEVTLKSVKKLIDAFDQLMLPVNNA